MADVWRVALRTPNVLQNLLGEGSLSASFIPIYARMVEDGREEEAGRFAGAALGLLATVAFGLAAVGILLAPVFVPLLLPEFEPWQQDLTVRVVRILFLMTATLVLSAWALGVLNTHRHFFVSYVAPVFWNLAIIATLVAFGFGRALESADLVVVLAWGALVGGVLQLVVQVPWLVRCLSHFRVSVDRTVAGVREAVDNLLPVVAARGVVNLSGWLDMLLAGLLATGAASALGYAQLLYMLPVSLFAMSIAAAELPDLSRRAELTGEVVARVRTALWRVRFLVVPSALAFLILGDVFVAALFQWGRFGVADTALVYAVLAAYALGLPASTSSRVMSSAFYALKDTRTPARVAYVRIAVSIGVGVAAMFPLDRLGFTAPVPGASGVERAIRFGATGLALGAAVGAWVEYGLLTSRLKAKLGDFGGRSLRALIVASLAAALAGVAAKVLLGSIVPYHPGVVGDRLGLESVTGPRVLALGTALAFGVVYLAVARLMERHAASESS